MQIIGQIIIPNVYSLYPDTMQIYYKQSNLILTQNLQQLVDTTHRNIAFWEIFHCWRLIKTMKVGSALSAVLSEEAEAEKKEPYLLRRRRRTTCWTLFHFITQPALAAVVRGTNLEFKAQTKQQMVEVSFNYKKCTAIPTHIIHLPPRRRKAHGNGNFVLWISL